MMTFEKAESFLKTWLTLLEEIQAIEIDCEMPPDTLTANIDRRQEAIDRIQQLDASLSEVRRFRFEAADGSESEALDGLMKKGRALSDAIRESDSQNIDIAKKRRLEILGTLQKSTLSRGYNMTNQSLKIRPPAIVDNNA